MSGRRSPLRFRRGDDLFSKLLIANRGEAAVRIIRACKEMGIATVAVYSTAARDCLHVALADQSVCIGEAEPSASYLDAGRIVSAALVTGAGAVHPGYGFLSESAAFAALCRKHGLAFVGPSERTVALMGDKSEARRFMRRAGVPVAPGTDLLKDAYEAARAAETIGYPVLVRRARARRTRHPPRPFAGDAGGGLPHRVAGGALRLRDGALYLRSTSFRRGTSSADPGRRGGERGLPWGAGVLHPEKSQKLLEESPLWRGCGSSHKAHGDRRAGCEGRGLCGRGNR